MSLLLYSQIPGTQVKRDANLSNATIQCDPKLLFPQGASQGGVPLNKENLAGKIAVEHDICNLDVNNLTVNGVLVANGRVEMCDIFCPDTFSVVAVNQITMQALGNPTGNRGNIALIAGDDAIIAQTPGTADECIMLSAASAGTQTQSADSHIMITAGEGNSTQQGDNSILISAAGVGDQLQQSENSILLTTNNGAVTQNIDGDIALVAQSQVSMEGVVQGIGMGFAAATTTDSLKMSSGGATTQAVSVVLQPGNIGDATTGGAVQAVLRLSLAGYNFAGTALAPGAVTLNFIYFNDKIAGATSNVLTQFNSGGSSTLDADVHFDIQVVGIAAGQVSLRVINVGSAPQSTNLVGGAIGNLNVLVINPL